MATISYLEDDSAFWYTNNGCTEHMAENRSFFSTYRDISKDRWSVQGIGDATLQAVGVGDIVIKIQHKEGFTYNTHKGVVHVPNLGRNLFSSYVAT
jgi:hypothetical protein